MSKNSQSNKPYHRRYSEPVWYRDQPAFPEGRDPFTDLFKGAVIEEISSIAGALNEAEFQALQNDLREIAFNFMCALFTTPLHLSDGPKNVKLTARKNHLDRHIIKPANRLLDALADSNAAMLSEWPETLDYPAPDKNVLINELRKLRDRTIELQLLLEDRLPNEKMTTEFLNELGTALANTLKSFFPQLRISRGTYHKTKTSNDPTMHGSFLSVMEVCVGEILPNDESLSNELIGELRRSLGP